MEQSITVTSKTKVGDFYASPNEWAVCRDILEEYFDLEDNPKKLTFTLSTEPSEESYPVEPNQLKMRIHLTDGGIVREAETGYTYHLLRKFNEKAGRPFEALIHISVA